jgi:hypothetical protein
MHRIFRGGIGALGAAMCVLSGPIGLHADGTEARLTRELAWKQPHITKAYAVNRSELGLSGSKTPAQVKAVGGQSCAVGPLIALDIDDAFAFDIDEPVDVTLTYDAEQTTPFVVAWDRNSGDGYRVSTEVKPEPGAGMKRTTLRLDRARFSGQGILKTDLAVGARGGSIALCGIEIVRSGTTRPPASFGQLRLEMKDAQSGKAVAARVGLYDATGRTPLPSDRAPVVSRFTDQIRRVWMNARTFWPSEHREAFYVNGTYESRVPAGIYDLIVTHGPEYRIHHAKIEVKPDTTNTTTVTLDRFADLPAASWFSGESHLHLGRTAVPDTAVWAQAAAEDLHLSNLLEMGNIMGTYFKQPSWGRNGRYERDGVALVSGQEDPRTVMRGHTIHWNIAQPTHSQEVFFQYQYAFERSRAQGGLTGYAHLGELFNGRRGLALDVPFGLVDFIEVLQGGRLATEVWYSFLNLGYKILPVGGADFPYFGPTLPGVERTYVKIDGPFSIDGWFAGVKQGHVYVTNGPFLEFTVNGRQMGEEIRVPRGTRLDVSAIAQLNPDVDRLDRIELVRLGDVAALAPANRRDRVELKQTLTADRSMWLAVRAYGGHQEAQFTTVAHSAPIYVVVDDEPTWKPEAVESLVALQRTQLNQLKTAPIEPDGDLESWETRETLVEQWKRQLPNLTPRIEQADARYQALLKQFQSRSSR